LPLGFVEPANGAIVGLMVAVKVIAWLTVGEEVDAVTAVVVAV
jgi:hypothetical protein